MSYRSIIEQNILGGIQSRQKNTVLSISDRMWIEILSISIAHLAVTQLLIVAWPYHNDPENIILCQDFATGIRILKISDAELRSIPSEVFAFTNLRKLYISKCSLQRSSPLTAFTRLTHVHFDNNDLEETTISFFPSILVELNLSFNHLTTIPAVLSNLEMIVELNLSSNRLKVRNRINRIYILQVDSCQKSI